MLKTNASICCNCVPLAGDALKLSEEVCEEREVDRLLLHIVAHDYVVQDGFRQARELGLDCRLAFGPKVEHCAVRHDEPTKRSTRWSWLWLLCLAGQAEASKAEWQTNTE